MNKDLIIDNFLCNHKQGISTIFGSKGKYSYDSLDNFILAVSNELKIQYDKLANKNLSLEDLNSQMFYLVNDFCKSIKNKEDKSAKQYLCPGCLFLGQTQILETGKRLKCPACLHKSQKTQDFKEASFYKFFSNHNSSGFKCNDCSRFIPKPDKDSDIVCPYFDCLFVGNVSSLKKMHHPSIKEGELISNEKAIEVAKKEINSTTSCIKDVIEYQLNNLVYSSYSFTLKHKIFVYQAFLSLLEEYPSEMSEYLLHNSRTGGFQHKVFQRYISFLEDSFPFVIKKNNKIIRIDNLLDDNLSLFDGVSVFEGNVNKNVVKNNTQEYYIGGRNASYTKPFYIGKLLNIINKKDKSSLMDNVIEYSFSKIKLRDIEHNTPVIVTHLRIPPHYQMGGMVYVNRIRKKIVDSLTGDVKYV